MIKQITEQLELPLECIYQLSLKIATTVKMARKSVPRIPGYIQLLLDFDSPVTNKQKYLKWWIAGLIGIAGILSGLAIG
ncbi:hypothetical protein [Spongiibacter tropicus]|uniref:hypothetical protein n=1 Tax=Spongiibacter tropicus TaxID=454602 RepID=UPI0012FA3656|nr:hypothetical protein [Spongiibacter tropicus]